MKGQPLPPFPPACLDAETLAAWHGGALPRAETARVDQHLADCDRCHTMLATFARIQPAPAVSLPWWRTWRQPARWLVPVATAATVAAVWVAIPSRDELREESSAQLAAARETARAIQTEPSATTPVTPLATAPRLAADRVRSPDGRPATAAPRASPVEKTLTAEDAAARAGVEATEQAQAAQQRRETSATDQRVIPPPATAPAPAPGMAAAEALAARRAPASAASFEVAAIIGEARWRVSRGTQVEYSADAGATWTTASLPPGVVISAGHAPRGTVAWLIGPRGTILLTTDGVRLARVPFIEPTDLSSVTALDDRQVTVVTVDGRVFRSTDRGATWTRQ